MPWKFISLYCAWLYTEKEVQWGKEGSAIHTHALPSKWLMHSSNVGQRTTSARSTRHGVGLPARAPLIFFLLSFPGSYSCFQVYMCVCVLCICIHIDIIYVSIGYKFLHGYLISCSYATLLKRALEHAWCDLSKTILNGTDGIVC